MFLKQPITAVLSGSITWRLRGLNKPPFVNKAPLIRAITEATGPQGHAVHDKYPPNRNNLPTPSKQTSVECVCARTLATIRVAIVPVMSRDLFLPVNILITFS